MQRKEMEEGHGHGRVKSLLSASFIMLGAAGVSAQIIVLRELLTVFYGNELSLGITLAGWMLLIALGSVISGKFSERISNKLALFSAILALLSIAMPSTVFLCRTIKHAAGFMPGEVIGFGPAFYFSLAVLSAFCVLYGFLFPLGARIYSQFYPNKEKGAAGAFFLEAAGAAIGGSITSLFLVKTMTSIRIAFLIGGLNAAMAALIMLSASRGALMQRRIGIANISVFALALLNLAAWPSGFIGCTEELTDRLMWQPFKLIRTENSLYGNIAVTSEKNQLNFYANGNFVFSFPDTRAAEETVHYAMTFCPHARNILLVGGGLNGSLGELYKYGIESVDYVELDPVLVEMAKEAVGRALKVQLANPALRIIEGDGRFYVKTTARRYDVIILSVPSPRTAQLNRFYTREFFTEAKQKLRNGGILFLACDGDRNYIGPAMAEYLGTVYKTLSAAGLHVKIIPGETIKFVASDSVIADIGAAGFQKILDARRIKTQFVRDYYLADELASEKIRHVNAVVLNAKRARVNTDFRPVSYYYDMVLWAAPFQQGVKPLIARINEKTAWCLLGAVFLAITGFGVYGKFVPAKQMQRAVLVAIGTTGFTQMAAVINTMLALQVIYGYLYYKIGLIVTAFMLGLFAGSCFVSKKLALMLDPLPLLKKSKIALSVMAFLLIAVFRIQAGQGSSGAIGLGSAAIFPFLIFIFGVIGGAQFPLANKAFLAEKAGVSSAAGLLYGIDLIGGMAGALLISTVIIPVLGIYWCVIAAGILNLASAIIIPGALRGSPPANRRLDAVSAL